MGFLRALDDAIDQNTVARAWRSAKPVDWGTWAKKNGWTYQAEAPELVGTWRDFDGIEDYRHLMRTTLHDNPVTSFECVAHRHIGWMQQAGVMGVNGFVVVGLPGPVAAPYASQRMDKTLRHFHVDLPLGYTAHLQDHHLIALHNGLHHPDRLRREADLIALLIAMAPGES
ncbi:MAG TPA: hypothetical protein VHT75_00155 [Acidimicrobiales bacterium]|jgi:hypothetical protein|nr:hypothetical protein [Acidimicrobiales bacterium]